MIINAKIDVTKIAKEKLFKGEKGTYLDAVIFVNDTDDQYGNRGMIVQGVTKEEREQGVRGAILGNIKIIGQSVPKKSEATPPPPKQDEEDLPF